MHNHDVYKHLINRVVGTEPAKFRALATQQIMKYENITLVDAKVHDLWKFTTEDGFDMYNARLENGSIYTARRVIMATGVTDLLPETPGVVEAFGKGLFWCPWCDGYEHRDQPLAVIGPLSDALSVVLEMRTINKDTIVLTNGTNTPYERELATNRSATWEKQLQAYNAQIFNQTITSIQRLNKLGDPCPVTPYTTVQDEIDIANDNSGPNGKHCDRFRVHFDDGSFVDRAAFVINVKVRQTSRLPQGLGLTINGDSKVVVSPKMETSIPGIFAVGDMNNDGSTNVPHAMFTGKKAAIVIHGKLQLVLERKMKLTNGTVALAKEESMAAISKLSKRSFVPDRIEEKLVLRQIGTELEQIWDKMTK